MRDVFVDSLLADWALNKDYGLKLVADLAPEQMVKQPHPGMNHPAWILSHLHAYHPVAMELVSGRTPADPLDHKYGMKSSPVADTAAYLDKDALIEAFAQGHDDVTDAMKDAGESVLLSPMPVERWKQRFPKVGSILPYLMSRHEALHLGQLSAWRRAMGLGRV